MTDARRHAMPGGIPLIVMVMVLLLNRPAIWSLVRCRRN